jgi:hypothetical protein
VENENREVSGDDTDGSGDGAGCNLFSPASSHFCDIFRATSQQNPPNQPRRRKTVRATLMSELFLNKQSILTDFRPSCYCFHFIVSSVTTRCNVLLLSLHCKQCNDTLQNVGHLDHARVDRVKARRRTRRDDVHV